MSESKGSELSVAQAGFRFVIEIVALVCWGIVGWNLADGAGRWFLVVALPVVAAGLWGALRAPGDHSAGGGTPVPVSGVVRLVVELGVLLGAAVLTAATWRPWLGTVLAAAVIVHYATTLHRVRWLVAQRVAAPAPR